MNNNKTRSRFGHAAYGITLFTSALATSSCLTAAWAGDHCSIDWNKLNLNPSQHQQIQALESQWNKDYNEIKPAMQDDQSKLTRLLADHTSDPVEIMSLQQSIQRRRDLLNQLATANYLKKRQLLSENQQFNLEMMVKEAVANRQRMVSPSTETDVSPNHIQNLMQRVRNSFWPTGQ